MRLRGPQVARELGDSEVDREVDRQGEAASPRGLERGSIESLADAFEKPGDLGLLDGRSGSTECLSSLSRRSGQQDGGCLSTERTERLRAYLDTPHGSRGGVVADLLGQLEAVERQLCRAADRTRSRLTKARFMMAARSPMRVPD